MNFRFITVSSARREHIALIIFYSFRFVFPIMFLFVVDFCSPPHVSYLCTTTGFTSNGRLFVVRQFGGNKQSTRVNTRSQISIRVCLYVCMYVNEPSSKEVLQSTVSLSSIWVNVATFQRLVGSTNIHMYVHIHTDLSTSTHNHSELTNITTKRHKETTTTTRRLSHDICHTIECLSVHLLVVFHVYFYFLIGYLLLHWNYSFFNTPHKHLFVCLFVFFACLQYILLIFLSFSCSCCCCCRSVLLLRAPSQPSCW